MESLYAVILICVITSVQCQDCEYVKGKFILRSYEIYLIGFAMLIMFVSIILLAIALYMIRNNKTILGININKKSIYVRQESSQGVTVRSFANTGNDTSRNGGSTLTVNSGIVQVSGLTEPETPTPTRIEIKDERKSPCIKKPLMPTIPTMHKAQMDYIIQQVLEKKRTERGSTTLRELDALTNESKGDEKENSFIFPTLNETDFKKVTNESADNENNDESLYENLPTKSKDKSNAVTDGDGVDGIESHINEQDEQEVYDMVPNPVRCENLDDGYIQSLPVYDFPARSSWEKPDCSSNAVLDHDTDYLLLLSKNRPADDKTSYINAKTHNKP